MYTTKEGQTVEVLKTFKGLSKNCNTEGRFNDLIKVRYSDGKEDIICKSDLI